MRFRSALAFALALALGASWSCVPVDLPTEPADGVCAPACAPGQRCLFGICVDDGTCEGDACGGEPADDSCFDWYACANTCLLEASLEVCAEECDAAVSEGARVAKDALERCRSAFCSACPDAACVTDCTATMCSGEYAECAATGGQGGGDCGAYLQCVGGCDPAFSGYAECVGRCEDVASPDALRHAAVVQQCLYLACPETLNQAEWVDCAEDSLRDPAVCGSESAVECFGPGAVGSDEFCNPAVTECLDCGELVECANACEDQTCVSECFWATTEYVYASEYMPIIDCLMEHCPDGQLPGCNQQHLLTGNGACAELYEFCMSGGATALVCDPAREACSNCSGTVDCVNTCPLDDGDCRDACLRTATWDAQTAFGALESCLLEHCPDAQLSGCDQRTLVSEGGVCYDQWTACTGQ